MRTLAVVGAGVIGLSVAWRAAAAGLQVTLHDPSPGRGASWVAGGMLTPLTEGPPGNDAALRLGSQSLDRWPATTRSPRTAPPRTAAQSGDSGRPGCPGGPRGRQQGSHPCVDPGLPPPRCAVRDCEGEQSRRHRRRPGGGGGRGVVGGAVAVGGGSPGQGGDPSTAPPRGSTARTGLHGSWLDPRPPRVCGAPRRRGWWWRDPARCGLRRRGDGRWNPGSDRRCRASHAWVALCQTHRHRTGEVRLKRFWVQASSPPLAKSG